MDWAKWAFRSAATVVAEDTLPADVHVHGRVEPAEPRGPFAEKYFDEVTIGELRFALIDKDGGVLYEDTLATDGSYDFTLPAGTPVGLDVDVFITGLCRPAHGRARPERGSTHWLCLLSGLDRAELQPIDHRLCPGHDDPEW